MQQLPWSKVEPRSKRLHLQIWASSTYPQHDSDLLLGWVVPDRRGWSRRLVWAGRTLRWSCMSKYQAVSLTLLPLLNCSYKAVCKFIKSRVSVSYSSLGTLLVFKPAKESSQYWTPGLGCPVWGWKPSFLREDPWAYDSPFIFWVTCHGWGSWIDCTSTPSVTWSQVFLYNLHHKRAVLDSP